MKRSSFYHRDSFMAIDFGVLYRFYESDWLPSVPVFRG